MQSFDDFLLNVPMFSGLEPSVLSDVNLVARPVNCAAGDYLFKQGQSGDGMYLIREGGVRVEVRTPGDEVLQVSQASDYDIVGEMALVDRGVRSASACAEKDTSAYFISCQRFEMLRSDLRPAAMAITNRLAREISTRCRTLIEDITDDESSESELVAKYDLERKYHSTSPLPCDHDIMRQFAMFEGFTDEEITAFIDRTQRMSIPKDVTLFSQGESPDGMYLVMRGALRFGHADSGQRQVQFNIHGPGQIAGLLEVVEGRTRIADLTTREESELLYVSGELYEHMLNQEDPVAFKFLANVNVQLTIQLRKINNIASRMASFGQFAYQD